MKMSEQDKLVGVASFMPGTDGFTMVCFNASDVPPGAKVYAAGVIDEIWNQALEEAAKVCEDRLDPSRSWTTSGASNWHANTIRSLKRNKGPK
jgi:hypothetical protein